MSELKMGSGPKPLHIGAVAGAVVVLSGLAYFFSGSDTNAKSPAPAAAQASAASSAPAATQAEHPSAPATAAAPPAEPAPATATVAETTPAAATALPDKAGTASAATAVAAAGPEPAPALASTAAPAPAKTADNPTVDAADSDSSTPVATASAEDNFPRPPVATPPPPASDVLDAWWTESRASRFGIDYVGQVADAESLAIVFTMPIDPQTLNRTVRVVNDEGKTVALDWQRGRDSRMAIASAPGKGRYTMIVAADTRGVQSPALGTSLHGPVYIQ